jgi:hypothetical protein
LSSKRKDVVQAGRSACASAPGSLPCGNDIANFITLDVMDYNLDMFNSIENVWQSSLKLSLSASSSSQQLPYTDLVTTTPSVEETLDAAKVKSAPLSPSISNFGRPTKTQPG